MGNLLEASIVAGGQTAANFAPIILGIVAILGLIGALKGFTRGFSRQLIRTITIVASVVISFILARGIYTTISSFFAGKTSADIEALLVEWGVLSPDANNFWIQNIDASTFMLALTIPLSLIVMPLAFVICFIVISGLMLIVHAILSAIFGFRKRGNTLFSRTLGMALGLLQGVAVAGLLLMPVIGISTNVSQAVEIIRADDGADSQSSSQIVVAYDTYVKSIAENPGSTVLGSCGVNTLYKTIATVDIDGVKTDMTALIPDVAAIAEKIMDLKGIDIKNLTPENESKITDLLNTVENNPYITNLLAGGVRTLSYAYTNGAVSLSLEGPLASLLDSAVSIFHTSDASNIAQDIETVKEVVFILSKEGVLSSFESGSSDMLNAFTKRDENGDTTAKRIISVINKNERTKPLISLITNLSISVMSQATGLDENTLAIADNIKAGINEKTLSIKKEDYATKEEYVGAVSASLDETLKENNITLEKDIVDNMALYIADNYGDKDSVTDDEANDIIIYYYDAYLAYTETQNQ